MKNITFYIILICAVTIINSVKHEKKVIKKKLPKLTDEILEEEARRDIENLLKDSKPYNVDDDDEYEYGDAVPTRSYDLSKTRTQINHSEWLIDNIVKLINNLDKSIQKNDIKRDTGSDEKIMRFDHPHSWDKRKPVLRNRYHQLMRDLVKNHGNNLKQRLGFNLNENDRSWMAKHNRFNQLMKSLDMNHRSVVKERNADEYGRYRKPLRIRTDDDVVEKVVDSLDVNKNTVPVVFISQESDTNSSAEHEIQSPLEDDTDVRFTDLLNGKYLRQKINKWRENKYVEEQWKSKFDDDIDINLVLRNGNHFYNKPSLKKRQVPRYKQSIRNKYGKSSRTRSKSSRTRSNKPRRYENRFRRSAFTQAGYTQDPDTCKTYNENLMKLWANLSKLINITEQPNERALHNIAIMIQAYLDHQNAKPTTESYKIKPEPPRDRIGEVILKIRKMLDDDESSSERVSRTIIKYLKPFYGDAEKSECQQTNEESLTSSVELLYRNYMENAECRNEEDGSSLNLRKRGGKNIQTLSSKWQTTDDDNKPDIQSILVEDELYKEISKGQVPRQRPPSKFRRIFKRSKNTKSTFVSRSNGQNMKGSVKPKTRARLHKPVAKKLRKSLLKTDLDKTKCEKYAIRKFTMSLRPVIDRFMSLLECELDNTLRSSNYDKISIEPLYLYASKYQSNGNSNSQQQKPTLRQMKNTRKNSGQAADYVVKKTQIQNRYELSNENDNSLFEQTDEYSYSKQISAEQIKVPSYVSDVLDSFKISANGNNNLDTKHNDDSQTPNYSGTYKNRLDNTNNNLKPELKVFRNNENTSINIKADKSGKEKGDENLKEEEKISFNMIYEENIPKTNFKEDNALSNLVTKNKNAMNNINALDNSEKPTLRVDDRFTYSLDQSNPEVVKSFESINDFLKKARDASMKTPDFAMPFDLSSDKGKLLDE